MSQLPTPTTTLTTKTADQLGDIVKISEEIYSSESVSEKIASALSHLNEQRTPEEAWILDKIISVTRQITNGFLYVFTVQLSSKVGQNITSPGTFKITYFQKHGKPENLEISLQEIASVPMG